MFQQMKIKARILGILGILAIRLPFAFGNGADLGHHDA